MRFRWTIGVGATLALVAVGTFVGLRLSRPKISAGLEVLERRQKQGDPRADDYDPKALLEGAGGLHGIESIFDSEGRHVSWAPAMEAELGSLIRAELKARAPKTSLSEIVCHTLICRAFVVSASDADSAERSAAMIALQMPKLTPTAIFGLSKAAPPNSKTVYFLRGPSERSPQQWRTWYGAQRAKTITELRQKRPMDRRLFPAGMAP